MHYDIVSLIRYTYTFTPPLMLTLCFQYDNLQKKYSEEMLSRSMTGSVSENSDPMEDTCSDGQVAVQTVIKSLDLFYFSKIILRFYIN